MLKVGITGGIGSGKSLISKLLESKGFKVFNSDFEAKKIINTDPEIKFQLINLFGIDIYEDGVLNNKKLANLIFNDESARLEVNQLIHPKVRESFSKFAAINSGEPVIFNEAAILIEAGGHESLDRIILVTAPKDIRVKRVMKRDGASEEDVIARLKRQWPDKDKIPYSDFIIVNDEETPLLPQVEAVVEKLLK